MNAFPILPVLSTVSAYVADTATIYCPFGQLQPLVEYVTGDHFGLSLPTSLHSYITTGIVVCWQHPRLKHVAFLTQDNNPIRIQAQLDRERERLNIPLTLNVTPPSDNMLAAARTIAPAIEQTMRERLIGVRK